MKSPSPTVATLDVTLQRCNLHHPTTNKYSLSLKLGTPINYLVGKDHTIVTEYRPPEGLTIVFEKSYSFGLTKSDLTSKVPTAFPAIVSIVCEHDGGK